MHHTKKTPTKGQVNYSGRYFTERGVLGNRAFVQEQYARYRQPPLAFPIRSWLPACASSPATRMGRSAISVSGRSASLAFYAVCAAQAMSRRLRTTPPEFKLFPASSRLPVNPVILSWGPEFSAVEFRPAQALFLRRQHRFFLKGRAPMFSKTGV
jgi:hypothetical protein